MKSFFKKYIEFEKKDYKEHKIWFVIIRFMWLSIIEILIRSLFTSNYENAAICVLALVLFMLPQIVMDKLKLDIPYGFQVIIISFIYASEILGEIGHFYTRFPGWDTMLHTLNGFNCAAVGFSLVHILNNSNKVKLNLSPLFVSLVGFCFSMTVGVLWEFFEFTMDMIFNLDMQKDFIIHTFGSVTLDPTGGQTPILVDGIAKTIIETNNGQTVVVEGGYLDIGIIDTMKDLIVNFIGAVVFCFLAYFYERKSSKNKLNEIFLIQRREEPIVEETPENKEALN